MEASCPNQTTTNSPMVGMKGANACSLHAPLDRRLVSNETLHLFEIIFFICLHGVISIIGISNNIVNIIVFCRQGILVESSTTSLLGLAVADLCCLVTMLWHSVSMLLMLVDPPGLPWDPQSVHYITAAWPHVMFTRVTCWITGFISLERCVCVTLPFKVKMLFTPTRSLTVVISIFVIVILCYFPIYYTHRLQWVQIPPGANQSKLILVFTNNKDQVEKISHYLNEVGLTTLCLFVVMVCTKITVSKINSSSKWRRSVTASGPAATNLEGTTHSVTSSKRPNPSHQHQDPTTSGPAATNLEVTTQFVTSSKRPNPSHHQQRESTTSGNNVSHHPNAQEQLQHQQRQHQDNQHPPPPPQEQQQQKQDGTAATIIDSKPEVSSDLGATTQSINSNHNSGKPGHVHTSTSAFSKKEKKVTRMVLLICIIFLACNTPGIIITYVRFIVPGISHRGQYHNLFFVLCAFSFLLETINSSINIVVFYTMGSRYRLEFNKLFRLGKTL